MPLKVIEIHSRSLAAKSGILAGDTILSINDMPVNDFFDLEYYSNDYQLDFDLITGESEAKSVTIFRQPNKALGIEPEPYRHGVCRNKCVFCFIDQLPPKLRPSLYNKDDDYLYSYVFGNYITLTNFSPTQLKRVISQHISPLYISVHSTDPALRGQMMNHPQSFDILKVLRQLARGGISCHFQIVCVPGYNCGEQLRKTLSDLLDGSLSALSVGVVPVGLTKYRQGLALLKPLGKRLATESIKIIDEFRLDRDIVYAADELYIMAGLPIPEDDYYGDFPQLENGIGMLRLTQSNFLRKRRGFIKELEKQASDYLILTSRLACSTLEDIAAYLNSKLSGSRVRVQAIRNDFLGEQIGVSGLLTASDVIGQHTARRNEIVILPSNMFNHEGLTLDDLTPLDLKAGLGRPLLVVDQFFEDWDWI
ncbi:MAG TPA: DUF512 domain-containing protein [Candidatus Syntrophosphaera sp.]|nr:DUF512 domain-containing protein [Candidatus Syntrophosphaera sp.]